MEGFVDSLERLRAAPRARNRQLPTEEDLRAKCFVPWLESLGFDRFTEMQFEVGGVDIVTIRDRRPSLFVELKALGEPLASARNWASSCVKRLETGRFPLLYSNGVEHYLFTDSDPAQPRFHGSNSELSRLAGILDGLRPKPGTAAVRWPPVRTESDVALKLVAPLLEKLGFDLMQAVAFEWYGEGDSKPDLLVFGGRQAAFSIEVKAPGRADDRAAQQAILAAAVEGVPYALLIDGVSFRFFDVRRIGTCSTCELAILRGGMELPETPAARDQWLRTAAGLLEGIVDPKDPRESLSRFVPYRPRTDLETWDPLEMIRAQRVELVKGLLRTPGFRRERKATEDVFTHEGVWVLGLGRKDLSGRVIGYPFRMAEAGFPEDRAQRLARAVKEHRGLWREGDAARIVRLVRELINAVE